MRESRVRFRHTSKSPRNWTQSARDPHSPPIFVHYMLLDDLHCRFGVEMLYIHESESFNRFRETVSVCKGEAKLVYHDNIGMRMDSNWNYSTAGILSDVLVRLETTQRLLRVSASGSNLYLPVIIFGFSLFEGVCDKPSLCLTVANEVVDHNSSHQNVGRI